MTAPLRQLRTDRRAEARSDERARVLLTSLSGCSGADRRTYGAGPENPRRKLGDVSEPAIVRERVLFAAHGVEVWVLEREGGVAFEKRVALGEHVFAITATSDDPREAAAWVRHLELLAELQHGARG